MIITIYSRRKFWTNYAEQRKEINQNCAGAENFDNCFSVIFERYDKNFSYERETKDEALSPPKFGILLMVLYFLRSSVLNQLITCKTTRIQCFLQ